MIKYILNGDYLSMLIHLMIFVIACFIVLISIGIDFFFGLKKSKERGVSRIHSFGLRESSKKVVWYMALMLFMGFIDFLNPIWVYFDWQVLPLFSILGAIVLVFTEWKSVREKADEKFRYAIRNNPSEIINWIKENRDLIEELRNFKKETENE